MAKFATNVSGAILLPSSIQVKESISGSVVPLAMFLFQKVGKCEESGTNQRKKLNKVLNHSLLI